MDNHILINRLLFAFSYFIYYIFGGRFNSLYIAMLGQPTLGAEIIGTSVLVHTVWCRFMFITLFIKLSPKGVDKREGILALSIQIRTRSSLILIIQLHQDLKIRDDDIDMRAGSLSGTM